MKLLYEKFQIPPETGNNRFIFQPIFRNKNFDFGFPRRSTLAVGNCFEGTNFTSYEGFLEKKYYMSEGAYLLLKNLDRNFLN